MDQATRAKSTRLKNCRKKDPEQSAQQIPLRVKCPKLKQFVGRLEWIQDHTDKPITSTPVLVPSKIFSQRDVQSCFGFNDKADTENFDEHNNQLSSICKEVNFPHIHRSPLKSENNKFNSLLVRYGMLEEKNRKEIPRTYTKKKPTVPAQKNVLFADTPKTRRRNSPKNSKKAEGKLERITKSKPKRQTRQKKPYQDRICEETLESIDKKEAKLQGNTKSKPKRQTRQKKPDQDKICDEALEWIDKKNREFENVMNFPLCVE